MLWGAVVDAYWRLRATLPERFGRRAWLRDAREAGLYAGYADWMGVMAVDESAEVWFIPHGETWAAKKRVAELEIRHAVRAQAAKRYPRVKALRYNSPPEHDICPTCDGTGTPHLPPSLRYRVVCQCGGLGWIPRGWDPDRTSGGQWASKGFEQRRLESP